MNAVPRKPQVMGRVSSAYDQTYKVMGDQVSKGDKRGFDWGANFTYVYSPPSGGYINSLGTFS